MREDGPSVTAQNVAAYRLGFERLPAPFGDPRADERLAADVRGSIAFEPRERMGRYLRFRTAFFDRGVVLGLERGVTQVAAIGAGYDGRSLRYAKDGVRWFELDHPSTQADKRARLSRLGIDADGVSFVGLDLRSGGTDAALIDAGWNPDALSLMLCEGLAVYLEPRVLATLVEDLRAVATVGTRLAISLVPPGIPGDTRQRFQAAVEAVGEPVRNALSASDADELLHAARWRSSELSERAQRAGCAVARPEWDSAADGARPTASRVGAYLDQVFGRRGIDGLPDMLSRAYGVSVTGMRRLDVGVFRVSRHDGADWVARVFPAARRLKDARGDAWLLRSLAEVGFPAERCVEPEPVHDHEGQPVLVTEYVRGRRLKNAAPGFELLGDLVGRLVSLPIDGMPDRPGGGWHHLCFQGSPRDEIAALRELVDAAAPRVPAAGAAEYDAVRLELSSLEDCEGLPQGLVHPDIAPFNAIAGRAGEVTLVDWTGAGRGPRLWPLAFLLWAGGFQKLGYVDAIVRGFRAHVALNEDELDRLAGAIATRPFVFDAWAFATGRKPLSDVVLGLPKIRTRASQIAARATAGFSDA
jgi:methyltransferase (TIGR00027 family)